MPETHIPTQVAVGQQSGDVTITFGPMPQGDVAVLFDYLRTKSAEFEKKMLDAIAQTATKHWDFEVPGA